MSTRVPKSLIKLERFVFRPLFVFTTFVLVLFAVVEVGGRFTLAAIHIFSDDVNQLLASREIQLTGLRGDWRGLNPVVRVDRATFPAGTLDGIEFELDVLESIFRSTLIARRIDLAQGELHVERIEGQWRLRGMPAPAEIFDVVPLVNHSDEMSAHVDVVLHGKLQGADKQETLVASVRSTNRGGRHMVNASIVNAAVADQSLQLALQRSDDLLWTKQAGDRLVLSGALTLPTILTGVPLNLNVVQGSFHAIDHFGRGQLQVQVRAEPPGVSGELSVVADLRVAQTDAVWTAVAEELSIHIVGQRFGLAPVHFRFQGAEDDELVLPALFADVETAPQFRMWLENIDLTELSQFASTVMGTEEPTGRWVDGLKVAGTANNVHVFFDPADGFGYSTSLAEIAIEGYGGAPTLRNVQGTLWGHDKGMVVQLNARDVDMKFPDLFNESWRFDHVQGFVKTWFGQGYFAIQGTNLKAEMAGLPSSPGLASAPKPVSDLASPTSVAGAFALSRPQAYYDQRLSLMLSADGLDLERGRSFIPYNIPEGLAQWLERGPRAANLSDARFAYHGQVHTRPQELGRRIEFQTHIQGGIVQYHPDWPVVSELSGVLHTAGVDTRVQVKTARSMGMPLKDSSVELRQNSQFIVVNFNARAQDNLGLEFVRGTPLHDNLRFITDTWSASGVLQVGGALVIPIADDAPPLTVNLRLVAEDFSLDMPEYRTHVEHLDGRGTFSLPHMFSGNFDGTLFGQPASFVALPETDWLRFNIHGIANEQDIYSLIEYPDLGLMHGSFRFDGMLSLAMADEHITHLEVATDLAGLTVTLPGFLAKSAEQSAPTEIGVQFLPDYQSIRWLYRDTNGWIHADDEILRGAIGVRSMPPMTQQSESAIAISGSMQEVRLSDWVSETGDAAVKLPLDWHIVNLAIDTFYINELGFRDVRLKGEERGDDVMFSFASDDLTGEVRLPGDDLMSIELEHLRLPVSEPAIVMVKGIEIELSQDPIPLEVARALPRARVHVAQLDLGDQPFGDWRFVIHPSADSILFSPFSADVNGVHIADSRMTWNLRDNTSSFQGGIDLDDLAETLPKWDYAASIQTEQARIEAESKWPGSPANVVLGGIIGDLRFTSENGRFLQVETAQGGLRIMSLLNLSTILGRIGGDFSDVTGSGVTFKSLEANVFLNQGILEFRDRLIMDSTASNFEIGGRVDLNSGVLDNELIVTLPVSESLPWYSAYLAIANPLLGLGVLVGERVLRKPIEQLSSAKFRVTGTLDKPQVDWVSIWDKSMREQVPSVEPAAPNEQPEGLVESGGK